MYKQERSKRKKKTPFSLSLSNTNIDKIRKIAGLLLIAFSIFLFYAFTSFLFVWKFDQNLVIDMNAVANSFKELKPDLAQNAAGLIGAFFSHLFMCRWFGISSYLFIFIFLLLGVKALFDHSFLPILKSITIALFTIFWISLIFGLMFHESIELLAGGFGIFGFLYMKSIFGGFGALVILVMTLLIFMVMMFNIRFTLPKFKTEREEKEIDDEENTMGFDDEDEEKEEDDDIVDDFYVEVRETEADEQKENTQTTEKKDVYNPFADVDFEIEKLEEPEDKEEINAENIIEVLGPYDPTLELSNYKVPSLDLLNDYKDQITEVDEAELEDRKNLILQTLRNYGIEIEKIRATVGSTVTLYEIIPAAGVRISKIKNLEDDIALSLSALGIRIIAPIPGKGTIGIEVPNTKPEIVPIKSVLGSFRFRNVNMELPFAIGKTISNDVFVADLTKMPHLLIAGATGQGKSVGLNVIISSLLYKKHPSQLKFVMVDPKKVELNIFQKLENHFLARLPDCDSSIITDVSQVIDTLKSLTAEMDERYKLLNKAKTRNIVDYNKKFTLRKLNPNEGHRYLPYIVLVIDELADLMMTAGKEVELPIARLAQLARAIGIHLIVATQRPSVNIITGTIKANFPARIAFKVSAAVDSRTIIDSKGAEQLIGRGDMLFSTGSDTIRIQCAFIDTPELEKLVEFIGEQPGFANVHSLPMVKSESDIRNGNGDLDEIDEFFEDAARIVVQHQQGSTSLLQRRLKLGYNRAGRIIDQLEEAGIVGPSEGSKARSVLIPDEFSLEQFLKNFYSNRE